MDREALLKSLGLTSDELQDLVRKFVVFQRELNPAQLSVVLRSLPTLERARASLGPTPEDLTELFRTDSRREGDVMQFYFLGEGDGNDGDGNN